MTQAIAVSNPNSSNLKVIKNKYDFFEIQSILRELRPKSINKVSLGITSYSNRSKQGKVYGTMKKVPSGMVDELRQFLIDNHQTVLQESFLRADKRAELKEIISIYTKNQNLVLSGLSPAEIIDQLLDAVAGMGPIQPLCDDPMVTDIYINRIDEIMVKRVNQPRTLTDIKFNSLEEAMELVYRIVNSTGQTINRGKPYANSSLGNLRVNMLSKEIAYESEIAVAIRKPRTNIRISRDSIINTGQASEEMINALQAFVEGGLNILVVGPTGSGKTELLKYISGFIPNRDRTFVLEDEPELYLKTLYPEKHFVSLRCRQSENGEYTVDYDMLLRECLREDPDRIIMGESRGKEALQALKIFGSGHPGFSSIHAESAKGAMERLILMIEEGPNKLSTDAIGRLIAKTINIVVFQKQLKDESRRIMEIVEFVDYVDGEVIFNPLFTFKPQKAHKKNGEIVKIEGSHMQTGYLSNKVVNQLQNEFVDSSLFEVLTNPNSREGE
ncbi:CpaF family protein [Bacillus cereus]|uniref:CpaF family protein n=1 Tax=Bacillus cereus group TaxID=86661 RepID=UPI0018A714CC|nr:ATPase, T2SS/T4P/T4SS family [Bacillus cereus]MBF8118788.1 CpaF family protein [Bacillus cereus]